MGVGASLSPAPGGWIAQSIGYSWTFMILGSFAIGSVALWVGFAGILGPACTTSADKRLPDEDDRDGMTA